MDERHNKDIFIYNYRILKTLGKGGMGTVYLVENKDNRQYALKIWDKQIGMNPSEILEAKNRFKREAEILSSLDSDCFVKMYEFGYCEQIYEFKDGRRKESKFQKHYIVMDYVDGITFKKYIESRGTVEPDVCAKIALAITKGLSNALKHDIIHRDIKPSNILIDKIHKKVKLADFGLGKIVTEDALTRTGELLGTPYYMAPEQAINSKSVDHRADIYALGATCYHALSGEAPYGQYATCINTILAKQKENPRDLKTYLMTPCPGFVDVIQKAMARNPETRYQTPYAMGEAIKEYLKTVKVNSNE